jgi:hypothetical protein
MSFYSYKNANAACCPGLCGGNVSQGLNEKICVQVKNVYDACLQQEQLDDVRLDVRDIIPVLPDGCGCMQGTAAGACRCNCRDGNRCTCTCRNCGGTLTYADALENVEDRCNCPGATPTPIGPLIFDSCRSSTTVGTITDLSIDRMCDRPQFARIRGVVHIPIDILFRDGNCQEWMGRADIPVDKDILLAIPDESIVPFTLESMVSAICVSGRHLGENRFEITICVTVVLKVLAEVELMIPSYGFCVIPPCETFSENVCDEFFSLPLFPQQACGNRESMLATATYGANCGSVAGVSCGTGCSSTCSGCGMTCGTNCSTCPRCGRTMTINT